MLLWVLHKTSGRTFVDSVSTDKCNYVSEFLDILYDNPQLAIPQTLQSLSTKLTEELKLMSETLLRCYLLETQEKHLSL